MDGTRSALIVASDRYTDPGLRQLRAPASDAQALAGVLRDPEVGGFQVRTLLNQPAHEVNEAVEEFFADRRPDDLLLLHVSCHGIKDEGGELYFATTNTKLRRLGATAVAAEFVNRRMSRSRSRRIVLLLDCCYAGAFERGMTARAGAGVGIEEQFGGRGRAVITASSAMEFAFEGDQLADAQKLQPSVFTSALVDGLETGEADRDQDGLVGLDELYDYVYDKVREVTPNQTPGKWTFGVQGELYIARRSRPVTTPAPLPPELQAAIDSPLTDVRAGAVKHLARLLQSRHAGLALAAKLTLEQLTEDDSRTVSAAATAALAAQAPTTPNPPRLELSATIVDFGRLSQHGRSPERRIRLSNAGGGTLNPRAETQASWLQLRQVGDELALRVDTTAAGERNGIVAVDSDGGSATIGVQARVEPTPLPASGPATATLPGTAPSPPEHAPAEGQHDAAHSEASTILPAETAPSTATTATPAVPARDDRRLQVAGGVAIAGAALLIVGLFPNYQFAIYDGVKDERPGVVWYVLIIAAFALGAGACMLIAPTRRLIGPALLLGAVAASTWGLVALASDLLGESSGYGLGFWVLVAAHLILLLAAGLAGLVLVRAGEVGLVRRPPEDRLAWLVALLGVASALAMLSFIQGPSWRSFEFGWNESPYVWATVLAFVVPACAALAVPRRFGAFLLVGWVGGGAALFAYYGYGDRHMLVSNLPIRIFGVTLLALLAVALFARSASSSQPEHVPRA